MQLNQDPNNIDSNNNAESQENNKVKSTLNKTSKKLWFILWSALAFNVAAEQTNHLNNFQQTPQPANQSSTNILKKQNITLQKNVWENWNWIIPKEKLPNFYGNNFYIGNVSPYIDAYINTNWDLEYQIPRDYKWDIIITYEYTNTDHKKFLNNTITITDINTLKPRATEVQIEELNTQDNPWKWSITLDNGINLTRNSNTGANEYFIEAYYTILNTEETTETGYIDATIDINNKKILHLQWQTPKNEYIKINIKLKDKYWKTYNLEWIDDIFYLETKEKTED